MKIIEFCGNPGCGKTTISNALLINLKNHNFKTVNYNQIKEKSKLKLLKYFFSMNTWKVSLKLFNFGIRNGINKRLFIYSIKSAIIIKFINKIEKEEKIDCVIFDEGIIQYLTTLSHGRNIGNEIKKLPKKLIDIYKRNNYYVIKCEIDIDENIKRINQRNRKGDRFIDKNINSQKEKLKQKEKNIELVLETINPQNKIIIKTNKTDDTKELLLFLMGDKK